MHMISGMDEGLETTDWTMENDYTRPEQLPEKAGMDSVLLHGNGNGGAPEEAVTI